MRGRGCVASFLTVPQHLGSVTLYLHIQLLFWVERPSALAKASSLEMALAFQGCLLMLFISFPELAVVWPDLSTLIFYLLVL